MNRRTFFQIAIAAIAAPFVRPRPVAGNFAGKSAPHVGVDMARYGEDRTALVAWFGGEIIHRETYASQGVTGTVGRVVRMVDMVARRFGRESKTVGVYMSAAGVSEAVIDNLREMGYLVIVPTISIMDDFTDSSGTPEREWTGPDFGTGIWETWDER